MSNRSKSLFRGPNVKHFALVHRSVRDPKLNDPEAGERVLSEVQRGKGKVGRIVVMGTQSTKVDAFWQGRTKDDLEGLLGAENLAEIRANEGEAALYGVYYDDTDYDYMQHMRMVGEKAGPDGEEYGSTLVEAPRKNDAKGKGKERTAASHPVSFRDATVDPDEQEEQTYREYLESSAQEEGLRPDMDPALREILEALEDEAYVEDDTASDLGSSRDGGNFLDALLGGSGKGDLRDRPLEDLFDEDELEEAEHGNDLDPSSTYATQVAKFKRRGGDSDDDFESEDDEFASEAGDTIAELRASSARRPPRKAKADTRSLASGSAFSMSSSSMFRNDGLTTLDDRFDQIEAMYEDDSDEEEDIPEDLEDLSTEQHTQLNNLMDEFLMKYEVLGGKMKPVLGAPDASGAEKLEQLREQFDKMYVLESAKRQEAEERARRKTGVDIDKEDMWVEDREEGKKWDVETVLSTYSNLVCSGCRDPWTEAKRSEEDYSPSRRRHPRYRQLASPSTPRPDFPSCSAQKALPMIRELQKTVTAMPQSMQMPLTAMRSDKRSLERRTRRRNRRRLAKLRSRQTDRHGEWRRRARKRRSVKRGRGRSRLNKTGSGKLPMLPRATSAVSRS